MTRSVASGRSAACALALGLLLGTGAAAQTRAPVLAGDEPARPQRGARGRLDRGELLERALRGEAMDV